jgi:ADP-ribose pyrophosphatase
MNENARWKILESNYVIESKYLRLRRDRIELPSGHRIDDYYVRETAGFSIIFALTPERQVVLVRQYKHGIRDSVLELPAGTIDPGEGAALCAQRELAEETGYVGSPAEPEHITTLITDPVNSNGRFHLFLVRNARPLLPQHLDLTEDITVELASPEQLRGFVRDGTIAVGTHVAAIYVFLDRLNLL